MKLANKISFVLDYQGTRVASGLVAFLVRCNMESFPDYLQSIFMLGADLESIKQDKQLLNFLKSDEIKPFLNILPEEYSTPLFREIQRNTVSEEYCGLVPEEIFDVRLHLAENLQKHGKLYQ